MLLVLRVSLPLPLLPVQLQTLSWLIKYYWIANLCVPYGPTSDNKYVSTIWRCTESSTTEYQCTDPNCQNCVVHYNVGTCSTNTIITEIPGYVSGFCETFGANTEVPIFLQPTNQHTNTIETQIDSKTSESSDNVGLWPYTSNYVESLNADQQQTIQQISNGQYGLATTIEVALLATGVWATEQVVGTAFTAVDMGSYFVTGYRVDTLIDNTLQTIGEAIVGARLGVNFVSNFGIDLPSNSDPDGSSNRKRDGYAANSTGLSYVLYTTTPGRLQISINFGSTVFSIINANLTNPTTGTLLNSTSLSFNLTITSNFTNVTSSANLTNLPAPVTLTPTPTALPSATSSTSTPTQSPTSTTSATSSTATPTALPSATSNTATSTQAPTSTPSGSNGNSATAKPTSAGPVRLFPSTTIIFVITSAFLSLLFL